MVSYLSEYQNKRQSAYHEATGMFLFARLVMRNLLSQTTKTGFRKEIAPEQFPRGLNEA